MFVQSSERKKARFCAEAVLVVPVIGNLAVRDTGKPVRLIAGRMATHPRGVFGDLNLCDVSSRAALCCNCPASSRPMPATAELADVCCPAAAASSILPGTVALLHRRSEKPLVCRSRCGRGSRASCSTLRFSSRAATICFAGSLCGAIHGSDPQFMADEDSVLLLAIPLGRSAAAARSSLRRRSSSATCSRTNISTAQRRCWASIRPGRWRGSSRQTVWPPDSLLRLAKAVQAQIQAERRAAELEREVEKLSDNLASTYEEICLLHGVTQNLRIKQRRRAALLAGAALAARVPAGQSRGNSAFAGRQGRADHLQGPHQKRALCDGRVPAGQRADSRG